MKNPNFNRTAKINGKSQLNEKNFRANVFCCVLLFVAILCNKAVSADPQIIRGPYLQNATGTSIVIMWETDIASTGTVLFGETVAYGTEIIDTSSVTIHEVLIGGLGSDSTYHYSIVAKNSQHMSNDLCSQFCKDSPAHLTFQQICPYQNLVCEGNFHESTHHRKVLDG